MGATMRDRLRLPADRRRAAASVLGLLLVLALVAPFAVFAVPQLVGADRGYVVLSGSMEPHMLAGDVVIVDSVPARQIRVGDVITYQRGGDVPTTHRVVGRVTDADGLAFRTMGDANEDPDPGLVRPTQVVGTVSIVIPYIGFVIQFANTPVGLLSLVVIPIGLLVVTEAWRYLDIRRARRIEAAADASTDATAADTVDDVATVGDAAPAPRRFDADGNRVEPATTPVGTPAESREDPASAAGSPPGYGVKTLDLGLTFLVLLVLAAYSGWMLYRELRVESAMVLAGAVMALLLVIATWVLASRAGGAATGGGDATSEPNRPTTDRPGGVSAPPSRPGERGQETTDD